MKLKLLGMIYWFLTTNYISAQFFEDYSSNKDWKVASNSSTDNVRIENGHCYAKEQFITNEQ